MQKPVRCPAILIAAPASGQGKTTVACALARLHARQGRRVRVFKCGPDFLDPCWHTLASGAPVYQMDLWMTGEADCRARLHEAAQEVDLIIVEGVMGLFDGEPSAADLAQRFGLPVLAVVDASGMVATFGALAFGLQHYRPHMPWAGVLANRVANARHAAMLQASVAPEQWLGAVLRDAAMSLPKRHLGLTVATEVADAMERLDAAADALADTPLGRMTLEDWQRWAVDFAAPETPAPVVPALRGKTIAANTALRGSLVAHVAAGKPVWAECGGMMALFDTLVTLDGRRHAQWGVLAGEVSMQKLLAGLGPQQLQLAGGTLRGHTFHYSTTATPLQPVGRTSRPGIAPAPDAGEAVWQHGAVRASYFHAWFPSCPEAVVELFSVPAGVSA